VQNILENKYVITAFRVLKEEKSTETRRKRESLSYSITSMYFGTVHKECILVLNNL
jgi:hypothetical protein